MSSYRKRITQRASQPINNNIKDMFLQKINYIVLGIILVYSLFVWWQTKDLPYHWDSAGFVINAARDLLNNNFTPFIAEHSDFAHPPLFIGLLALTWKLFGQTIHVSHLFNLPLLPIYLFSTYLIAKKLTNTNTAILSTSILAFIPTVLAEYGMIYIDLPTATFFTTSIAALVYEKKLLSIIFLIVALGIKIPILATIPAITYFLYRSSPNKKDYKTYLVVIIPILLFIIWPIYHYQVTGWWLIRPERVTRITNSIPQFINSLIYVLKSILINHHRWILSITAAISIIILQNKKGKLTKVLDKLLLPILISISGIAFFAFTGEYTTRYGLFFIPFIIISFMTLITSAFKQFYISVTFTVITIIAFISNFHPRQVATSFEFGVNEDLSYRDMIIIGEEAAHYLNNNYPDAEIYGGWPENYQLTQPYQGYTQSPLNFYPCSQFQYHPDVNQIIYLHPYSPGQIDCHTLALKFLKTKELVHIQSHNKFLKLTLVEATNSAIPTPQQ